MFYIKKYPWLPALFLFVAPPLFGQNTVFGEAKIVPESEVKRQSEFIDAEKERLLGNYDKAIDLYKKFLYENPLNDVAWYSLSKAHFAKNDPGSALDAVSKAVANDPQNEWYRIFQSDMLEKLGKNKEAVAVYETLVKQQPGNTTFLEKLAYLQVLSGDPKAGLKTLDKLEALAGVREETAAKKHMIFIGLGDFKKAAAELQKLINAYPRETAYRHRLAQFYESINDKEAARKVYEEILKIDPRDPVARLAAVERPKSGSDAVALQNLQSLFADPSVAIDAKIREIAPYFEKLEKGQDPALTHAMLDLGAKVENAHPNDPKAWSLSGDIAYLANQPADALVKYRKCIRLNPTVFSVWENMLSILADQQNWDELYPNAEQAIDAFPNQPKGYYFFGVAANAKGKPEQALPQLEQSLLMTANNPTLRLDIYAEIGQSLLLQKKYDAAAKRLEGILAKGGDQHAGVLERYGDAQSGLGNTAKAREYWQKAYAIYKSESLEKKINSGQD